MANRVRVVAAAVDFAAGGTALASLLSPCGIVGAAVEVSRRVGALGAMDGTAATGVLAGALGQGAMAPEQRGHRAAVLCFKRDREATEEGKEWCMSWFSRATDDYVKEKSAWADKLRFTATSNLYCLAMAELVHQLDQTPFRDALESELQKRGMAEINGRKSDENGSADHTGNERH